MAGELEQTLGRSLVERLQEHIRSLQAIQASGVAKEEIARAIDELQRDVDKLVRWAPFVFIGSDD
jgi:hypothetical protein